MRRSSFEFSAHSLSDGAIGKLSFNFCRVRQFQDSTCCKIRDFDPVHSKSPCFTVANGVAEQLLFHLTGYCGRSS